ncbi:hypothetical protein H7H73_32040 [Mycobacterium rufum]|uniref:Uncharacterized protein n=1 Tax=Mycolicibacterium rufum TaxID=318424 RepID=A0A9X3BS42_9MYCO|nr:hypothetical protein [Mycolicibacterium rufum]
MRDLTVSLADPSPLPLIDRVLIRPSHAPDLLVAWSAVAAVQQGTLSLAGDAAGFAIGALSDALDDDEILLGRDVLDTQVVDIAEQRLARVATYPRRPERRLCSGLSRAGGDVGSARKSPQYMDYRR